MNNFKKLLASAMALTMVASVLPVSTPTYAINVQACTEGRTLLDAIMDAVEEDGLEKTEFYGEEAPTVAWGEETYQNVINFISSDAGNLGKLEEIFEDEEESCATSREQTNAEYVVNVYNAYNILLTNEGLTYLFGQKEDYGLLDQIENRRSSYSAEAMADQIEDGKYTTYDEAVIMYNFLESISDYEGNFTQEDRERIAEARKYLRDELSDVDEDFMTTRLEAYVEMLEDNLDTFISEESEDGEDANDNQKSITEGEVTNFLKALKNDGTYKNKEISISFVLDDEAYYNNNYDLFKNADEVVAIVDSIEAMYDDIELVDEVTNTVRFEAYADFLDTKEAGDYDGDLDHLTETMKMDDFAVYETFKEEVVDVVYTFETREYSNYYSNRSAKSPYITLNGWASVKDDFGADLVDVFDRETGTFGWDALAAHMAEVEANYNALTEGLEGIDAINVAVDDREAILAADDALFFFEDGDAVGNLTTAQRREVRDAVRKVEELLEAYRSKFGTVGTTTGWVDMGNGNWNYYEADGTAPTKWICSAPNTWYYVLNGNMMRNYWVWRDADSAYYVGNDGIMVYGPTTVDGYAIDANGLWHR